MYLAKLNFDNMRNFGNFLFVFYVYIVLEILLDEVSTFLSLVNLKEA